MQKTLRICVEFNLPQCTDGGNAGGEGSSAYNGRCKAKGEEGLSQLPQLLRGQPPLDAVDILLFRSDQISRSVVTDSLRPHESQRARPPCPSPTPGIGDGQGGLACCDSWSCKESDMTERLN